MVRAGRRLPVLDQRPKTRGECVDGPRPCPWVTCRHHLFTNISSDGRLWINHPDGRTSATRLLMALKDEPEVDGYPVGVDRAANAILHALRAMSETCALDIADRDEKMTLEQVAGALGIYKQTVELVENEAMARVKVLIADEHPEDTYIAHMAEDEIKRNR